MQQQSRLHQGLAAAGFTLCAMAAAPLAMHFIVSTPKRLTLLAAAAIIIVVIYRGGEWLLPLFIGLVWTTVGASSFKLGAWPLLGYAIWNARRRPLTARRAAMLVALFALPQLAAALISTTGFALPFQHIADVMFIFLVALGLRSGREMEHAGAVLAFVGIFLGIGSVMSIEVGPDKLFPLATDLTAPRAAGPFGDPNFFALALASLMPFAMEVYERGGGWYRLLGFASALSIVGGLLGTGSRGGLIAAGAAVLANAFLSRKRSARPLAAAVIVAAVVLIPTVFAAQAADSQARTVRGRADENLIAARMFLDHPLAGVGPDNYPILFRDYARKVGNDPRVLREPHSLPLQIASEQGVVGILAWLGAAVLLVSVARSGRVLRRPIGRAVVLAIATYLVGSAFLHGSELRQLYMLVGLLVAVAGAREEPDLRAEGVR
jgi:O-antigen ligase